MCVCLCVLNFIRLYKYYDKYVSLAQILLKILHTEILLIFYTRYHKNAIFKYNTFTNS